MEAGLLLEKKLAVVSVVAFAVLQAVKVNPKPAITNEENTSRLRHVCPMMSPFP